MSTPPPPGRNTTPRTRLSEISPSRSNVPTSAGQGLARNPSLRSARPIRKAPTRTSIGGDPTVDEDVRAANAQIIADLKEQVDRAEQASEQYRKQLDAMQKRLDEVANGTMVAEEREFQLRTQIDKMQAELRDSARQSRELGLSFEEDKKLLIRDRDHRSAKEAELQSIVNRLTETLRFRNQELAHTNQKGVEAQKTESFDHTSTTDDQDYIKILERKDNTIESLRLELADLHLKFAEQEHMGDGTSQALEKELLDVKMRNARLQEENESFQMLLSEKTLKGDFLHDQPAIEPRQVNSLAEELESAGEPVEYSPELIKLMEAENKTLRDSNKALTLYVDKIIGRLLQHEGFEHIITNKDETSSPPVKATKTLGAEKALPEIPPSDLRATSTSPIPAIPESAKQNTAAATAAATATATASAAASAAVGFLQRARSVVSRPGAQKPRPMSYIASSQTANENPETAPSIPLARGGHRRARSDQANDIVVAPLSQQTNRNSSLRTVSGGPLSPTLNPLTKSPIQSQRTSYAGPTRPDSSSNSVISEQSQEVERESTDASSARASVYGGANQILPGAVMKQSQLRPLRLVQEQADEDAQKKANRGSWMGWFNKGNAEQAAN